MIIIFVTGDVLIILGNTCFKDNNSNNFFKENINKEESTDGSIFEPSVEKNNVDINIIKFNLEQVDTTDYKLDMVYRNIEKNKNKKYILIFLSKMS